MKALQFFTRIFLAAFFFLSGLTAWGQMNFTAIGVAQVIDFENTVSGVNEGTYDGSGFVVSPVTGDLDADAWAISGMSDGDKSFGVSNVTGDYARGVSTGVETYGGLYAFDVGSGDIILGIQPIEADFTPGTITLKITNNTGITVTAIDVSYNILSLNNENRSNSLNFSHSSDNSNYTSETMQNFNTIEAADNNPQWQTNARYATIAGLNLASGSDYYLRWTGNDVSGSGSRDEYGIDDISVTLNGPIPSAQDGIWYDVACWVGGVVPGFTDDVIINHDIEIPTNIAYTVNSLTINSGNTFTLNNTANLNLIWSLINNGTLILGTNSLVDVAGNLQNAGTMNLEPGSAFNQSSSTGVVINSGTINIKHNASFVQKYSGNDANTNSGTYNVLRTKEFEDQTRYSFWSSPVTGETAEDVFFNGNTQTNTDDWIRWDYSQGTNQGGQWVDFYTPGSPTTLLPGIGYGFTPTQQSPPTPNNITDTRTFSSSTINNGNIDVTLTGAIGDDWALLGNPYPSNLNISNFLSANDQITDAVYIWSDNAYDFNVDGGYFTINSSGITATPSSQSATPSNQYIAPMQGFFVQLVQSPGDQIVHFTNNQRAAGNSTFLKTDPAEYAWLSLAHESGTGNQVVVGLKDQSVAGYAQGEDSPCLKMSATMEFYVTDPAKDLTIEYRPKPAQSVDYVPLGLDAWATGPYTFALDSTRNWDAAVPVMLLDSMLGQMVDLHQTDYTFNVNFASPIRDRFYLVLDDATVGEEELSPAADSWYWYQAGDQLHIEGAIAERITLRNTHGQTVAEVSHQTNLGIEGLARGIYILEVATAGTTTAKKVVLK